MSHTEMQNTQKHWPIITAKSKSMYREGYEFRLTYHSEYGFGLEARQDYEDWVDVCHMQDQAEVSDVICEILSITLETS